ncbi:MAG: PIN domain-containing protein [Coriobacteriia bacterium]
MDRLFLDANVLVSAALKPDSGLTALWRLDGVRLLASPHVVVEARRNVPDLAAATRLGSLLTALAVLPVEPADFRIDDDPGLPDKDRPVLLAAIVSKADFLLTGDISHFGTCIGRTIASVRISLPGDYLRSR